MTKMSLQVERAIAFSAKIGPSPPIGIVITNLEEVVHAVAKVMREPSNEAIANGVEFLIDANLDGPDGVGESDARGCWQAMLAAEFEVE